MSFFKDLLSGKKNGSSSDAAEWPKVVWITGASSGLGMHTAGVLAKNGFTVIAGARSFNRRDAVEGCCCLPLDVTDDASMDSFVHQALEISGTPDVLINCAGIVILGACESYETDELRQVMETNFYGMASMISRVLPLMRQQGRGRIVNYSSVNGLLGIPFEGAYTASKHAVEGYSECLALETMSYGIEVMLVEPGGHQGSNRAYRRHSAGMTEDSPYWEAFQKGTSSIVRYGANGADPDVLGQKVADALRQKQLPRRMLVGKGKQRFSLIMHDLLPARVFDRIIYDYYINGTE